MEDKSSPSENGKARKTKDNQEPDHHSSSNDCRAATNGKRKSKGDDKNDTNHKQNKKRRHDDDGSSVASHHENDEEEESTKSVAAAAKPDAAAAGGIRKSERRRIATSHHDDTEEDDEGDVPVKEIHMTRKEREEEERIRKLDSSTLAVLRGALSGRAPQSHLNDDEMLHFMARVDRDARHISHLQGGSHPEDSDGSVLEELVAEAEDLALGREVLHKAISCVHKSHAVPTDRRTIEWVRKASGLGKTKMETFLRENAEAGRIQKSHANGGRFTRNMARSTREERREKGLGILLSAVDELEDELGPYPVFKPKKRKRPPPEKVAPLEPVEAQKTPKANNRKKVIENKRKSDGKSSSRAAREAVRDNGVRLAERREDLNIAKQKPTWDDVRPPPGMDIETYDFPMCKTDSSVYARKSVRLIKRMTKGVLLWSRYEFFYSDVDRAWFNRNEFVRKAARLGIRPGTLLTQREWNVMRRQIRAKPRRFSKRFIEHEYNDLQNYRVHVRMLQNNPDPSFATRLGFDYEVPKPIPVGAPISAVAQRRPGLYVSSPIQRGSVLSFSHGFYVVQLTGGIALLPDFMVARHGPTDILIPAPRTSLVGMREAVVEESGPTPSCATWSGPGSLHVKPNKASKEKLAGNAWLSHPDVPKLTESELIVTVMANAEMALKRKKTILETMEALDSVGVFDGTHQTSAETKTSVQKHLNWLLDSLDEANESYKLAKDYIEHLTEMPSEESTLVSPRTLEKVTELGDSVSRGRDSLADSHATRLLLNANIASNKAVLERRGEVAHEMTGLLRSVGQLLLVSAVHTGRSGSSVPDSHVGRAMQTAVAASVEPLSQMFCAPPDIPDVGNFETHLYQNALKARERAVKSLMEAANLLNIEFSAGESANLD